MKYTEEQVREATLEYFHGDVLATNVWMSKYALQDDDGNYIELTPDDMHWRMAKEFSRIESKYDKNKGLTTAEIYGLFKDFKYIVPGGSIMFGLGNNYGLSSLSNCTVLPEPKDSISGIMNVGRDMANLFKARCGSATGLDSLRPDGYAVSNSAKTSTGAASFAKYFSDVGLMIGAKGRRAAEMLWMSVNHPDVEEFVTSKTDRTSITGANISVKIFNDFMEAVINDTDYVLKWKDYKKTVRAKELWELIVETATKHAEPGLLFWDHHLDYNPSSVYEELKPIGVNPCIVGDTKVYVADGRGEVTIKELAEAGKDVPVFCYNDSGKVDVRWMRHPRITGYGEKIYKVTLDDGSEFRVTGNHKFRLKNGDYVEAVNLKNGDSLAKITKIERGIKDIFPKSNSRSQDYVWLDTGVTNKTSEHRLISEFYNGKTPRGSVVHHIDFNAKNNSPDNLKVMTKKEHDQYHGELIRGDNNPMRRAKTEWSKEKWKKYRSNMSEAVSGIKNGRAKRVSNADLYSFALGYIAERGYRPSNKEWFRFCNTKGLPKGPFKKGGWREKDLGTVSEMLMTAAIEVGVPYPEEDSRVQKTFIDMMDAGLDAYVDSGVVMIKKVCEVCGCEFHVDHLHREQMLCSSSCASKRLNSGAAKVSALGGKDKYEKEKSAKTKEEQARIYSQLKFENGIVKRKHWAEECKKQGVPYENIGRTRYGYGSWEELEEAGANYNHKVVSVVEDGFDDVYNGTVEDFHNFFIACDAVKESPKRTKVSYINNLQCGEQPLAPHDACRLISCNVSSLVKNPFTDKAEIDEKWAKYVFRSVARIGDGLVDLEIEKMDKMIDKAMADNEQDIVELWKKFKKKSLQGRRIGIGVHGLADMLAKLRVKYDSQAGIDKVSYLMELFRDSIYGSSVELAVERGPFELFDWEKEKDNQYIARLSEGLRSDISKHGRRNVTLLTMAPTGSVSLVSKTSSGIEPVFRNSHIRRRKLSKHEECENVITMEDGERFEEYEVFHHNVEDWKRLYPDEELPSYFVESDNIDWLKRVEMQQAIQYYVDASISSTVNLPKETKPETVGNIYMEAWKRKIKGITVYVDGSRGGILVTKDDKEDKEEVFKHVDPVQRPETLPCDIHHATIKGEKWTILVGLLDNKPYELFAGLDKYIDIGSKVTKGEIRKKVYKTKPNRYDLLIDDGDITIKDIVKTFENNNYSAFGRVISLGLRHGTRPAFMADQLAKDNDFDFENFNRVVGRCLKKYIVDGEEPETDKTCPACGEDGLVYEGGCKTCKLCGVDFCG